MKVLLVDGGLLDAEVAQKGLTSLGADVTVVADVTSARKVVQAVPFGLIVSEFTLSDGDVEPLVLECQLLEPAPAFIVHSESLDAEGPARLRRAGAIVIDKKDGFTLLRRAAVAAVIAAQLPDDSFVSILLSDLPAPAIERAAASFADRRRFSATQRRMLSLATANFTNRQIASKLGMTEGTVRTQWGRAVAKLSPTATGKSREFVFIEFIKYCAAGRY